MSTKTVVAGALLLSVLLSGCSHLPPLREQTNIVIGPPHDVTAALQAAAGIEGQYRKKYNDIRRNTKWLSLPTVLGAMGAATVLVAAPAGAAKVAGYIGIGATGWETWRGSMSPRGLLPLYAKGVAALNCVRGNAAIFAANSGPGPTPLQAFGRAHAAMAQVLADTASLETESLPATVTDAGERKTLSDLRDELSRARATAQKRRMETVEDLASAEQAGIVALETVNAIEVKIVARGTESVDVAYPDLLARLKQLTATPPATPKDKPAANPAEAPAALLSDFQNYQQDLTDAIAAVKQATAEIDANARPYKARLDAMRKCPDGI